jgi:hypothetical protein
MLSATRTTEPPILSSNHPIRRAFYRHGTSVARHWLAYILVSVSIAVFVCYPVFFLYENPSSGFSRLPNHVWTSASRFEAASTVQPDVEIRQVWAHAHYRRALDVDVLQDALKLQNAIILGQSTADDKSTHEENACYPSDIRDMSWGFHSPLMFWNCSAVAIAEDHDVLRTIQDQSLRRSYFNLTLRPISVFAGKSFLDTKLSSADALVITMFDRPRHGRIREWDTILASVAEDQADQWSFYPSNGVVTRSQLYLFQWKPISVREDFLLCIAYLMMIAYLIRTLRRTRAVKSQLGIGATIITQVSLPRPP